MRCALLKPKTALPFKGKLRGCHHVYTFVHRLMTPLHVVAFCHGSVSVPATSYLKIIGPKVIYINVIGLKSITIVTRVEGLRDLGAVPSRP